MSNKARIANEVGSLAAACFTHEEISEGSFWLEVEECGELHALESTPRADAEAALDGDELEAWLIGYDRAVIHPRFKLAQMQAEVCSR